MKHPKRGPCFPMRFVRTNDRARLCGLLNAETMNCLSFFAVGACDGRPRAARGSSGKAHPRFPRGTR